MTGALKDFLIRHAVSIRQERDVMEFYGFDYAAWKRVGSVQVKAVAPHLRRKIAYQARVNRRRRDAQVIEKKKSVESA